MDQATWLIKTPWGYSGNAVNIHILEAISTYLIVAKVKHTNGDEYDVQNIFENVTSTRLKQIFGDKKYVVIDEAPRLLIQSLARYVG